MRLASKTTNDGWIVWAYPYNKEEYENFFSWCLKAFKHSKNEVLIGLDSESLQPLTLKITGKSLSNRTAIFLAWSDHTVVSLTSQTNGTILLSYSDGLVR